MTAQTTMTAQSPFLLRLWAYLQERFPLGNHGLLIASYYSSNQFLAQVLSNPESPVRYSSHSLLGAITLLCMFFHLRVFDEHKDYDEDCRHYPERILSRGLITLRHLKIMGAVAISLELLLSAWQGVPALVATLVALFFSLLMLKEFFVGTWLKQHFLVYAFSHMLIMPLFAMVAFSFTTNQFPWQAPAWFWLYAFVGFFVTLNWEISRKIRAPEDEIIGVDSYSKIFGTYGAAYLVIAIRFIDTALVSLVGYHLGLSPFFYGVLMLLFLICLIGLIQFRTNTTTRTAKRMESYAGMYIIAFDLTLAIEIVRAYSIEL
ncbi:MAG: UbiA family prenyltransferase [Proteobacteria bacterium]|nr:UbiA family prenyltransferase [Pseudomonadota bacterium]MBU1641639.1 UbiA family prenyltransferase [Pseudomonadota bacterium]